MISWFRYVRHADREAFEAKGWRFCCELLAPHGEYSIIMIWEGEHEPV